MILLLGRNEVGRREIPEFRLRERTAKPRQSREMSVQNSVLRTEFELSVSRLISRHRLGLAVLLFFRWPRLRLIEIGPVTAGNHCDGVGRAGIESAVNESLAQPLEIRI